MPIDYELNADCKTTLDVKDIEALKDKIYYSENSTLYRKPIMRKCGLCDNEIDQMTSQYAIVNTNGNSFYLCWKCVSVRIGDKLIPLLL
jgi:hypothetical protein